MTFPVGKEAMLLLVVVSGVSTNVQGKSPSENTLNTDWGF